MVPVLVTDAKTLLTLPNLCTIRLKITLFVWTDREAWHVDMILKPGRESLISSLIFAYPTGQDIFVVDTDASNSGMGPVISRMHLFRNSNENRCCVTRRVLLTIVAAVKIFITRIFRVVMGSRKSTKLTEKRNSVLLNDYQKLAFLHQIWRHSEQWSQRAHSLASLK